VHRTLPAVCAQALLWKRTLRTMQVPTTGFRERECATRCAREQSSQRAGADSEGKTKRATGRKSGRQPEDGDGTGMDRGTSRLAGGRIQAPTLAMAWLRHPIAGWAPLRPPGGSPRQPLVVRDRAWRFSWAASSHPTPWLSRHQAPISGDQPASQFPKPAAQSKA
jgi:hypothetical protein